MSKKNTNPLHEAKKAYGRREAKHITTVGRPHPPALHHKKVSIKGDEEGPNAQKIAQRVTEPVVIPPVPVDPPPSEGLTPDNPEEVAPPVFTPVDSENDTEIMEQLTEYGGNLVAALMGAFQDSNLGSKLGGFLNWNLPETEGSLEEQQEAILEDFLQNFENNLAENHFSSEEGNTLWSNLQDELEEKGYEVSQEWQQKMQDWISSLGE